MSILHAVLLISQIYQSDVDIFGIQVPPSCPSTLITIYVEHHPETVKKIDYSIPLKGIKPDNIEVIIVRSLNGSTTSKQSSSYWKSFMLIFFCIQNS